MAKNGETKVHYKMYKDGKRWVTAGIYVVAMTGFGLSAVALSPMQTPVAAVDVATQQAMQKVGDEPGVFDITPGGKSSISVPDYYDAQHLASWNLQLILNGDTWTVRPAKNFVKADMGTVLEGMGFPSAEALENPTTPENQAVILDYLKNNGLNAMNGVSNEVQGANIQNTVISGAGLQNSNGSTISGSRKINGTDYTAIVSGNVTGGNNGQNGKILVANGGVLTGKNSLPGGFLEGIPQHYAFADGSMADSILQLKDAAVALTKSYDNPESAPLTKASSGAYELDFSKAKIVNGQYVFTVNTDNFGDSPVSFQYANAESYAGGDIVINAVGSKTLNMSGQHLPTGLLKDGTVILSSATGTPINRTWSDDDDKVLVLAPNSNYISPSAKAQGFVGAINGNTDLAGKDGNATNVDTTETKPGEKTETGTPEHPNTTTVTKTATLVNNVGFDILGDFDAGDLEKLPADLQRTATVTYTETTDSTGKKSYSDFKVVTGLGEVQVTDVDGYDLVDNGGDLTDDAIIKMVQNAAENQAIGASGVVDAETTIFYQVNAQAAMSAKREEAKKQTQEIIEQAKKDVQNQQRENAKQKTQEVINKGLEDFQNSQREDAKQQTQQVVDQAVAEETTKNTVKQAIKDGYDQFQDNTRDRAKQQTQTVIDEAVEKVQQQQRDDAKQQTQTVIDKAVEKVQQQQREDAKQQTQTVIDKAVEKVQQQQREDAKQQTQTVIDKAVEKVQQQQREDAKQQTQTVIDKAVEKVQQQQREDAKQQTQTVIDKAVEKVQQQQREDAKQQTQTVIDKAVEKVQQQQREDAKQQTQTVIDKAVEKVQQQQREDAKQQTQTVIDKAVEKVQQQQREDAKQQTQTVIDKAVEKVQQQQREDAKQQTQTVIDKAVEKVQQQQREDAKQLFRRRS